VRCEHVRQPSPPLHRASRITLANRKGHRSPLEMGFSGCSNFSQLKALKAPTEQMGQSRKHRGTLAKWAKPAFAPATASPQLPPPAMQLPSRLKPRSLGASEPSAQLVAAGRNFCVRDVARAPRGGEAPFSRGMMASLTSSVQKHLAS
jgi:hypothetical protein